MTDCHCHLNHERFADDLAAVLDRAWSSGVTRIIVAGFDLPSSRAALAMAEEHPRLWATVGVHPHAADSFTEEVARELRRLAAAKRVVAIGEIGLDYHYEFSSREAQLRALVAQLDLARELGLPVVLHSREAESALLDVLARAGHPPGLLHCWQGTPTETEQALATGLYVGVGGMITFSKRNPTHALIPMLPHNRLVLETDAPYLAPVPMRGHRNEPAFLPYIAREVAARYGCSMGELEGATENNVTRLFPRIQPLTR